MCSAELKKWCGGWGRGRGKGEKKRQREREKEKEQGAPIETGLGKVKVTAAVFSVSFNELECQKKTLYLLYRTRKRNVLNFNVRAFYSKQFRTISGGSFVMRWPHVVKDS